MLGSSNGYYLPSSLFRRVLPKKVFVPLSRMNNIHTREGSKSAIVTLRWLFGRLVDLESAIASSCHARVEIPTQCAQALPRASRPHHMRNWGTRTSRVAEKNDFNFRFSLLFLCATARLEIVHSAVLEPPSF